jgi:hypothetical protein
LISHTLTSYDPCLRSGSELVRQEEGGLACELEALETGWRLGMHDLVRFNIITVTYPDIALA